MSKKLPRITAKDIIKVLNKVGFYFSRQNGSHKIYKNTKNDRVTIPSHSGEILKPKTLKKILDQAELSVDNLLELL